MFDPTHESVTTKLDTSNRLCSGKIARSYVLKVKI